MENFIEESMINDWKKSILNNPHRLQQETEVIQRYGTLFNPVSLDYLTKEDFKSFLLMKNNRHWNGIFRSGNKVTEDMGKLREGLKILLDESRDLKERLDFLFPIDSNNYIKGLGRAIITPILMMVYPTKYGVWNSKSEAGLESLGLLPKFKSKDSFANRYLTVNEILIDLAQRYDVTLWQLDEIIGCIALGNTPITTVDDDEFQETAGLISEETLEQTREEFGLESHLEDFLIENWDKLEFGQKYDILEEAGDMIGQQYITPIGRMDILAKSKDGKEWLVIELKKGKSSDQVVGQILRYMGWLAENKASQGESVSGLIIVGDNDDKLSYSLKATNNIKLMTYSVSFKLFEV
jgi:hypothetical protein